MFPEGGKVLSGVNPDVLLRRVGRTVEIRVGEPLTRHTTFGIGGKAAYYVIPDHPTAVGDIVRLCRDAAIPYVLLGAGSNVLFPDGDYAGVVISTERLTGIRIDGSHADVYAGTRIGDLINRLHRSGIHSLDFLSGIPGTMGGAIAMNAGIPAETIGDLVEHVWAVDDRGRISRFAGRRCRFSYRNSVFREKRLPILTARLRLDGPVYDGQSIIARRMEDQPVAARSAGCVFKNPPGDAAGRLIEAAGLKGFRVGMAKVSEKHANFIINLGGASSADIRKLIDIVRQKVYKSFRILLELEIEVIDG